MQDVGREKSCRIQRSGWKNVALSLCYWFLTVSPVTAPKRISVGSRTSTLALAQSEEVLRCLRPYYPETEFVVVPITTHGDKHKTTPLLKMDRGMFAREIEETLLRGEIDFAVHSAKDLTTALPDGLVLAAFSERLDPRDVLVNKWNLTLTQLPPGARLGTSSPRRTAQLKALRPDIEVIPIRGNVDTRLNKARGEDFDGVVLAAAGLIRLGRQGEIAENLAPDVFIPEIGQGALAVQARADASEILEVIKKADHWATSVAVRSERAFLEEIGGGCKVPATAYAQLYDDELHIYAIAALPDGSRTFRVEMRYGADDPESAGKRVAEALMEAGASEIVGGGAPP